MTRGEAIGRLVAMIQSQQKEGRQDDAEANACRLLGILGLAHMVHGEDHMRSAVWAEMDMGVNDHV